MKFEERLKEVRASADWADLADVFPPDGEWVEFHHATELFVVIVVGKARQLLADFDWEAQRLNGNFYYEDRRALRVAFESLDNAARVLRYTTDPENLALPAIGPGERIDQHGHLIPKEV